MSVRRLLPVLLVVVMLAATVVAAAMSVRHERNVAQQRADDAARRAASALQLSVATTESTLTDAAGLLDAVGVVDRRQFNAFGRRARERTGLHAVGWIERVGAADLAAYERRVGRSVLPLTGLPARARPPTDHLVVTFVNPDPGTGGGLAVDVGTDPARRATLERAASTGTVAATPPLTIYGTSEQGVVLYQPVYAGGGVPAGVGRRAQAVRGWIFAGYLLEPLLAPTLRATPELRVEVRDAGVPLTTRSVIGPSATATVDVGGRSWSVVVMRPALEWGLPLTLLFGGLVLTAVTGGLAVTHLRRERYARDAVVVATRDLRLSRERYQTLVENSPDVVVRLDRDLRHLYVSPSVQAITGLPPDTYIGRTLRETSPPPDLLDLWTNAVEDVFETAAPVDLSFSFPTPDGGRHFHTRLVPEGDPGGEVASVLLITRDVTERRRAADALRESESRYRSLVASMADGVVVHGPDGSIIACNPSAETILGLTAAQLEGRAPMDPRWQAVRKDGAPFPGEEHPAMVTLTTGRPQRGVTMGVHRPDGSLAWLSVSTEPHDVGDPAGPGVVACFTDVTERVVHEHEQEALRRLATLVASEAEPRRVFEAIAQEAGALLGAEAAGLARFDAGDLTGSLVGIWGQEGVPIPSYDTPVDLTAPTAMGLVASTQRVSRVGDSRARAVHPAVIITGRPVSSAIAAPIMVNGRLWGALAVATTANRPVPAVAEERLTNMAEIASMAIMSSDARAQLARLASTDHLTGLWNRRAFQERIAAEIERARRHGRPLSLVVMDIDHFKLVNDTHGHPAGDRVLIEVARRLFGNVRNGEVVARVGGEEFAWILPETDGAGALQAAERVRAAISATPFPEVGRLTASLGVCELSEARDGTELFRLADVALYWAKSQGRDRVFRYSPETLELLPPQEHEVRLNRAKTLASVRALARAVDAKDPSTQRHSERVADLAVNLALGSGWSEAEAASLREAALVHDVGKIAVSDAILLKPGRLDAEEYAQITEHARIGATMLQDVLDPAQVAWVRGHHERHDGTGYPDGLRGAEIPEGARLLALADAWDAMTAARPYGAPLPRAEALAECRREAGRQFDPGAVEVLERLYVETLEAMTVTAP